MNILVVIPAWHGARRTARNGAGAGPRLRDRVLTQRFVKEVLARGELGRAGVDGTRCKLPRIAMSERM